MQSMKLKKAFVAVVLALIIGPLAGCHYWNHHGGHGGHGGHHYRYR
jgi:hypothetical protein